MLQLSLVLGLLWGCTQFQFLIACSKTRTEGQSYLAQETQDHIPHEGVESGYDSKALASESVLVKCIRGMTGMTCVQSCPFKGKCSTQSDHPYLVFVSDKFGSLHEQVQVSIKTICFHNAAVEKGCVVSVPCKHGHMTCMVVT